MIRRTLFPVLFTVVRHDGRELFQGNNDRIDLIFHPVEQKQRNEDRKADIRYHVQSRREKSQLSIHRLPPLYLQ
jgi:hypothetical protein